MVSKVPLVLYKSMGRHHWAPILLLLLPLGVTGTHLISYLRKDSPCNSGSLQHLNWLPWRTFRHVLPEGGLGQTQDMFRDSTSHLAWKHLGVPLPEAKEMAGKREVFFD